MFAMSDSITHPTITILCTLVGNVPMSAFRGDRPKNYLDHQINVPIDELVRRCCPIFRREADTVIRPRRRTPNVTNSGLL
jgi:hypothetical protein